MLEKNLQSSMIREAKKQGLGCDKVESKSRRGWPDLLVFGQGRIVLVEVKTPTGRLHELQEVCHRQLRDHGLDVRVCKSLNEFREVLYEVFD